MVSEKKTIPLQRVWLPTLTFSYISVRKRVETDYLHFDFNSVFSIARHSYLLCMLRNAGSFIREEKFIITSI
jgi:hypothetical protein